MNRKKEILALFDKIDTKELIVRSVDEMLFLEEQLETLRKVPHIKYHPKNPSLQKRTEAGKLYKEYLQQYNNLVKSLIGVLHKNDGEADISPLRAFAEQFKGVVR